MQRVHLLPAHRRQGDRLFLEQFGRVLLVKLLPLGVVYGDVVEVIGLGHDPARTGHAHTTGANTDSTTLRRLLFAHRRGSLRWAHATEAHHVKVIRLDHQLAVRGDACQDLDRGGALGEVDLFLFLVRRAGSGRTDAGSGLAALRLAGLIRGLSVVDAPARDEQANRKQGGQAQFDFSQEHGFQHSFS